MALDDFREGCVWWGGMEEGARLGGEGSDEKWQGWFGLGKTVLGPRREASQTHQIYWDREHTHMHTHTQTVPNLGWFDLEFFDFVIVKK